MSVCVMHKYMPRSRIAVSWDMTLQDDAEVFSGINVSMYTPICNVQVILLIYILSNIWYCQIS